ncbi:small membrane protein YohP [Stutzerimonas marianensis]
MNPLQRRNLMLKFLGSTIGIIFLIGLLVVIGLFALIF